MLACNKSSFQRVCSDNEHMKIPIWSLLLYGNSSNELRFPTSYGRGINICYQTLLHYYIFLWHVIRELPLGVDGYNLLYFAGSVESKSFAMWQLRASSGSLSTRRQQSLSKS